MAFFSTFLPNTVTNPNPNLNPNPNPNPELPNADLPTTISILNSLLSLAETTLTSVSSFFFPDGKPSQNPDLCHCPYDPRHRTPPESLFHHSLRCSSAPGAALVDPGILLRSLRYPKTLRSDAELQRESPFIQPLPECDADLCFSLDRELCDASSFFYKDCPGVVRFPEQDESAGTFTLPAILAVHCANFVRPADESESGVWNRACARILPSELWELKSEVSSWRDYPGSYSYTVLRVASCLGGLWESDSTNWMISSSARHRILIDTPMRDHIFLLLKLCLKAICLEAGQSLTSLSTREGHLDPSHLRFDCPHLVRSLVWLASQLSILYGEERAKVFSVDMLKEVLLQTGSSYLIPYIENPNKEGEHGILEGDAIIEGSKKVIPEDEPVKLSKNMGLGRVFVSQVAAAVAALHERSSLETNIKELRFPHRRAQSQIFNEHCYTLEKANEERGRRANYKPLLEHDGLLWQQSQNQNKGRPKTREELLAEERDYKRRRMSYRGKKVKRTAAQVLHDIIEDHMEEIRRAGGIGCNVKGSTDDTQMQHFESNPASGITAVIHEVNRRECNSSQTYRKVSNLKKELYAEGSRSPRMSENTDEKDRWTMDHNLDITLNHQNELRVSVQDRKRFAHKDENDTYSMFTSSTHRSHRRPEERYASREPDNVEKRKYDQHSSNSYRDKDERDMPNHSKHLSPKKHHHLSDGRISSRGKSFGAYGMEPPSYRTFEDRYDPSISYDPYEDSQSYVSPGSKYDKFDHTAHDASGVQTHKSSIKKYQHDP